MNRLPHLAQRMFNVPLLIRPEKAEIIMAALADRLGVAHLFHADGQAVPLVVPVSDGWGGSIQVEAYETVKDVAVIPIEGTLVHRLGEVRPVSGMTGYDGIAQCFMHAVTDPGTRAIVLDIDSGGGECAGCADLADLVWRARGIKPIWAILNEGAYSAAYWLASACDRITVPRTGGCGNVGAIMLHADMSKALAGAGVTVTVIAYGALKGQGFPEIPLSTAGREMFAKGVEIAGGLFAETVARNRGLARAAVDATEAALIWPEDAVRLGFADAVMSPADAFSELLDSLETN